jgi:hypothetical protein
MRRFAPIGACRKEGYGGFKVLATLIFLGKKRKKKELNPGST